MAPVKVGPCCGRLRVRVRRRVGVGLPFANGVQRNRRGGGLLRGGSFASPREGYASGTVGGGASLPKAAGRSASPHSGERNKAAEVLKAWRRSGGGPEALRSLIEARCGVAADTSTPPASPLASPLSEEFVGSVLMRASREKVSGVLPLLESLCSSPDVRDTFRGGKVFKAVVEMCKNEGNLLSAFRVVDELADMAEARPSVELYNAVLLICQRQRNFEKAKGVLRLMRGRGVRADVESYNAALGACAAEDVKGSGVEEALALVNTMIQQGVKPDSTTLNLMMGLCLNAGRVDVMQDSWEILNDAGAVSTSLTYARRIEVSCDQQAWERAFSLLVQMNSVGMSMPSAHVGVKLLEGLERHGTSRDDLNQALTIITDGMTSAKRFYDKRLFTLILRLSKENGRTSKLFNVFRIAKQAGHTLTYAEYSFFLIAAQQSRNFKFAWRVWTELKESGMRPAGNLYGAMIDLAGRTRKWELALSLFKEMSSSGIQPHVVVYNSMILAAARASKLDTAISIYREMQHKGKRPNVVTYTSLIRAYALLGDSEGAAKTYSEMIENKVKPNLVTINVLLSAYQKTGEWEKAEGLIKEARAMGKRFDIITWTTLMSVYDFGEQYEKGFAIAKKIAELELEPTSFTYATLSRICEKAGEWDELVWMMRYALDRGYAIDPDAIGSTLVAMTNSNMLETAIELFSLLQSFRVPLSAKAYGNMVHFLKRHGMANVAVNLEDLMRQDNVKLDTHMYNILLSAISIANKRIFRVAKTMELYGRMRNDGVRPDVITLNTIAATIGKAGDTRSAIAFLGEYRRQGLAPGINTYCNVFNACKESGDGRAALSIFNDMSKHVEPLQNSSTMRVAYNSVLGALAASDMLMEGVELYEQMKVNLTPDSGTESAMIEIYSKLGNAEAALDVLEHNIRKSFDDLARAKNFHWTIHVLRANGRFGEALTYFGKMVEMGVCPQVATLDELVDMFRLKQDAPQALLSLEEAFKRFPRIEKRPYWGLIALSSERPEWHRSFFYFEELCRRGGTPHMAPMTALATACIRFNREEDLEVLIKVVEKYKPSRMNALYNSIINAYTTTGDVEGTLQAYRTFVQVEGFTLTAFAAENILLVCARYGKIHDAKTIYAGFCDYPPPIDSRIRKAYAEVLSAGEFSDEIDANVDSDVDAHYY